MSVVESIEHKLGRQPGLVARNPVTWFFVLAYAFTWLAWSPFMLSRDGFGWLPFDSPLSCMATIAIGTFGPTLAALLVTSIDEGRKGVRRFLARIVQWRFGAAWFLFALVDEHNCG